MASSIFIPDVVEENESGIFATNPVRASLPVITAATSDTRADAHNRIRQELIVVACAKLSDSNFAFDSSFLAADSQKGFLSIAKLLKRHKDCPMTLFGHADPKGELRYNHFLSERRARSVFAVLIRDISIWEKLFTNQEEAIGDVWGTRALDAMHIALGDTAPTVNTPAARQVLFTRYMDFLRGEPTLSPKFPTLTTNDFLGRGQQKATLQGCSKFNPQLLFSKTQQAEFDKTNKLDETRNLANEPNRRVLIYFFAKGTLIDPALWPCPSAVQGQKACEDRQWSNGKDRRSTLFVNHRRRFGREVPPGGRLLSPPNQSLADELGQEETTFGCRFYHGIALHSPCERDLRLWGIQLLVDGPPTVNPVADPPVLGKTELANKRFVATVGTDNDAPVIRGTTSDKGVIAIPLFDPKVVIELKVDAFAALVPPPKNPPDPAPPAPAAAPTANSQAFPDEDQFVTLTLDAGVLRPIKVRDEDSLDFDPDFDGDQLPLTPTEIEGAAMQRLYNLGFGKDDTGGPEFSNWKAAERTRFIRQFQTQVKITVTGVLDQATIDALFTNHGS